MSAQTFVALVVGAGDFRNMRGEKVAHITDASCRRCGFSFGRKDVRNIVTGALRKGVPVVDDALALAAARALGLPPVAALFASTETALAAEAVATRAARGAQVRLEPEPDDDVPNDTLSSFLAQQGQRAR